MKNKRIVKIIFIVMMIALLLGVIGVSYAYFTMNIVQNQKLTVLNSGDLKLRYTDNTELSLENALPGDSIVKTFTVENIGSKKVSYNIIWNNLINTINNYDLQLDMKCKSYKNYNTSSQTESGSCDSFYKAVPYTETSISKDIKRNNEIDAGITHEYTVTITFKNRSYLQNDNLNKSFSGKIDIEEYVDPSPEAVYCTFDGTLTQGAEYVNGQYTYRYKQEGSYASSGLAWYNISTDGWGVQLTDRTSTDAVISSLCTYINNKPIVSMSYMFDSSKATSIDLSSFITINVSNMYRMFYYSQSTSLNFNTFNTSNVTNMSNMFENSQALSLDLSMFDTSNIKDMNYMFAYSGAQEIDLSSFNTSKVTGTNSMFYNSAVKILDLSSFDTSNVTNMNSMFTSSKATLLNLNNFNTSNVTDMSNMFMTSEAATIYLDNFDTSKVINMSNMFYGAKATSFDLSNFNTSNVTNMHGMFADLTLSNIDLSSFDTSKVTNMSAMFDSTKATTINLESFDTSNVTNMGYMFRSNTNLQTIYVSDKFKVDNVTSSTYMFYMSSKLVGGSGTKYSAAYVDKTYARIDGGTSNPGYFTAKN